MMVDKAAHILLTLSFISLFISQVGSDTIFGSNYEEPLKSCDLIRGINASCSNIKRLNPREFCEDCTWKMKMKALHQKDKVVVPPSWNLAESYNNCEMDKKLTVAPPRNYRLPFHTHIHKSGGSLMCTIAMKQPGDNFAHRKLSMITGCNMVGDGPSTIAGHIVRHTASRVFANRGWCCEGRYRVALLKQRGLLSREIFFHGSPCPTWFIYSIFLRSPLKRIESHFRFHKHKWVDVASWLEHTTFSMQFEDRHHEVAWPFIAGSAPYNNYNVRILGGETTFFTSIEKLNGTHLQLAKDVLDVHEVVITLEHFEKQKVQLERFLGWTFSPSLVEENKRATPIFDMTEQLTVDQLNVLSGMNLLDSDLYMYGRRRSWELTELATKTNPFEREVFYLPEVTSISRGGLKVEKTKSKQAIKRSVSNIAGATLARNDGVNISRLGEAVKVLKSNDQTSVSIDRNEMPFGPNRLRAELEKQSYQSSRKPMAQSRTRSASKKIFNERMRLRKVVQSNGEQSHP